MGAREGLWQRLRAGLSRTRAALGDRLGELTRGGRVVDDAFFEELWEVLVEADVGVKTADELVAALRARARGGSLKEPGAVRAALREEVAASLRAAQAPLRLDPGTLRCVLVVGVNGSGKTTTAGKLAARWQGEGRRVLLGATDTFRAAAPEQLAAWARRSGAELVAHQAGSDPAAVAFDAVQAARARGIDLVVLDTAGRLQTRAPLMEELRKIHRVAGRALGRDPDEVLLVLDATTGQNALSQARLFQEAVPLTGLVLTKLDGTARGGAVLALARELGLPVKLVGIGEGLEDLRDFDPDLFARALVGEGGEGGEEEGEETPGP